MRNSSKPSPLPSPLSATADYALRAVLVLARADRASRLSAESLATATGAPANYLAKTLNALAKTGIVTSTRGPLGGFALARPASHITVAQIADAFAEPRRSPICLLGSRPCDSAHPCTAHARWSAVATAIHDALATTTMADLLPPAATRAS